MSTMNVSRRCRLLAAAALAFGGSIGLAGSVASAGTSTVDFSSASSVKGLGSFQGSATLDGGLLTVQTTNASARGYLYGLAFDIDGGKAAYASADGKHGFKSAAGKHGLSIKPFGKYQDAVMVKGSAKHGVAAGSTKTFVFKVSGASADATAYDLLNNAKGKSIVALFKGFRHGAKDKAGAAVVLRLAPSNLASGLPASDSSTGATPAQTVGPVILPPTLISSGPGTHTGGSTGGTGNVPGGTTNLPGGDRTPAAVPLPPAAWSGLGTLALLAGAMLKRKGIKALA